jgi:hypothetical protein
MKFSVTPDVLEEVDKGIISTRKIGAKSPDFVLSFIQITEKRQQSFLCRSFLV